MGIISIPMRGTASAHNTTGVHDGQPHPTKRLVPVLFCAVREQHNDQKSQKGEGNVAVDAPGERRFGGEPLVLGHHAQPNPHSGQNVHGSGIKNATILWNFNREFCGQAPLRQQGHSPDAFGFPLFAPAFSRGGGIFPQMPPRLIQQRAAMAASRSSRIRWWSRCTFFCRMPFNRAPAEIQSIPRSRSGMGLRFLRMKSSA